MRYSLKLVHNIGEENLPHITFTDMREHHGNTLYFLLILLNLLKESSVMNISEIIFSGVLTLIIFIIIFLFLKVDKLEKEYHIFTDEHTLRK